MGEGSLRLARNNCVCRLTALFNDGAMSGRFDLAAAAWLRYVVGGVFLEGSHALVQGPCLP